MKMSSFSKSKVFLASLLLTTSLCDAMKRGREDDTHDQVPAAARARVEDAAAGTGPEGALDAGAGARGAAVGPQDGDAERKETATKNLLKAITLDEVKTALAGGADVNAKDARGLTVLHRAAERGYEDIVTLLLSAKADVNAKDPKGLKNMQTALDRFEEDGYNDLIDKLGWEGDWNETTVPTSSIIVDPRGADGSTPLHLAAQGGHMNIVTLLLNAKADVDALDNDGRTVLHWAAEHGRGDLVKLLLSAKADVNAQDKKSLQGLLAKTDLDKYSEEQMSAYLRINAGFKSVNFNLREYLRIRNARYIRNLRYNSPLELAWQGSHMDIAKLLLDGGADVNVPKSMNGITFLHEAIRYKRILAVQYLLGHHADIQLKELDPKTYVPTDAFDTALTVDHMPIMILLFEHAANLDSTGSYNPEGRYARSVLLDMGEKFDKYISKKQEGTTKNNLKIIMDYILKTSTYLHHANITAAHKAYQSLNADEKSLKKEENKLVELKSNSASAEDLALQQELVNEARRRYKAVFLRHKKEQYDERAASQAENAAARGAYLTARATFALPAPGAGPGAWGIAFAANDLPPPAPAPLARGALSHLGR